MEQLLIGLIMTFIVTPAMYYLHAIDDIVLLIIMHVFHNNNLLLLLFCERVSIE